MFFCVVCGYGIRYYESEHYYLAGEGEDCSVVFLPAITMERYRMDLGPLKEGDTTVTAQSRAHSLSAIFG